VTDFARLIRNIQAAAVPTRTFQVATVTYVKKNDYGMAESAIATIGNEANVPVSLANGIGTITHVGEQWIAELDGGASGRWRLRECIESRFLRIADQTDVTLPTPQVPDTQHGGIYTESSQAGVSTPNANPDPGAANANVYIYYWTVLPSSYSVYDQGIRQVVFQTREDQFEEWERTQVADLYPNQKVELTLAGSVSASGTAIPVSGTAGYGGYLLEGQPAYWRIENEVILGIYAAGTITVMSYTGPGDPTLGEGFTASTGGRGQSQGGSATGHDTGSVVELLVGQLAVPNLRPGTNYELQIAFANQASRPGPWSAIQAFTTWEQTIPPSSVTGLAVDQQQAGMFGRWNRVITDTQGNARSDIRRYRVWRSPIAGTAGGTVVSGVYPNDFISTTSIMVPSNFGTGNYLGVQAIDDSGNAGALVWEDDANPPTSPDYANVTFQPTIGGIDVSIAPTDSSLDDPSNKEFIVLRSSGTAVPTGGTWASHAGSWDEVGRFRGLSGKISTTFIRRRWYQVVAGDWGGNKAEPGAGTANWKPVRPGLPEATFPFNGNWELPDPDANGTVPLWWSFSNPQPGTVAASYAETGGLAGSRVVRWSKAAGAPANIGGTAIQTVQHPYARKGKIRFVFQHRESSGSACFYLYFNYRGWKDEELTVPGGGGDAFVMVHLPSGGDSRERQLFQSPSSSWQAATVASLNSLSDDPSYGWLEIAVWPGSAVPGSTDNNAGTIWIDDVQVYFGQ
jgi:hypothetical protein